MSRNADVFSYQLKRQRNRRTVHFVVFMICLYVFVNLVNSFLVFPVRQHSVSMIPDVSEKSVVMFSPVIKNYTRGDVVLLKPRDDKKPSFIVRQLDRFVRFFTAQQISILENSELPSSKYHTRRIVALPGDTIYMRDYVLYVKPAGERHFLTEFEIVEEPYNVTFYVPPTEWDTEIGVKGSFEEFTLGSDQYFVLADNRKSSDDSRLWGAVNKEDISAKALMCYFPFRDFKIF
ncbi:MAG: signal peptidase I [Treponema sp.]|nr:signal peptidase I [Treponema sp.]